MSRRWMPWFGLASWLLFWHWFVTWEVWTAPCYQVPGPIGDNVVMLWNLGWVDHALSHGQLGAWFENAYYPEGFLFLWGTHTWLYGFLGWLAQPVLPEGYRGFILWANLIMAFSSVATGLLAAAGLRQWGVRRWPVLWVVVSGLVFCWFRMFSFSGHYHFAGTEWMVGALACASRGQRLARVGRARGAIGWFAATGLALGLTFLNDQTHTVFATALLLPIFGSMLWRRQWKMALFGGAALTIAAVPLMLVHVVPVVEAAEAGRFEYRVPMLDVPRLVDASSLVVPGQRHWLGSGWIDWLRGRGLAWAEGTYLGIVPLGLLVVALLFAALGVQHGIFRTRQRVVLLLALFFLLMALGDRLMIGKNLYFELPGKVLRSIPVVNNIRLPQRWVWPGHLCLALAGGLALQWALRRMERRVSSFWAAGLLVALAAIPAAEGKNYPPPATADMRDPFLQPAHLVDTVRARYNGGGVLLMPMEYAYAHSNVMQFLWGYDIPVVTAYTARAPFDVTATPWRGEEWTEESGDWLRQKRVSTVVFSFQSVEGLGGYEEWIRKAKVAVPGLVVLDKNGVEL